jgi:hypothetical protein
MCVYVGTAESACPCVLFMCVLQQSRIPVLRALEKVHGKRDVHLCIRMYVKMSKRETAEFKSKYVVCVCVCVCRLCRKCMPVCCVLCVCVVCVCVLCVVCVQAREKMHHDTYMHIYLVCGYVHKYMVIYIHRSGAKLCAWCVGMYLFIQHTYIFLTYTQTQSGCMKASDVDQVLLVGGSSIYLYNMHISYIHAYTHKHNQVA